MSFLQLAVTLPVTIPVMHDSSTWANKLGLGDRAHTLKFDRRHLYTRFVIELIVLNSATETTSSAFTNVVHACA